MGFGLTVGGKVQIEENVLVHIRYIDLNSVVKFVVGFDNDDDAFVDLGFEGLDAVFVVDVGADLNGDVDVDVGDGEGDGEDGYDKDFDLKVSAEEGGQEPANSPNQLNAIFKT
ncbi:unnamed protein product [Ambrosiozyma monospora]|uniref:Unnamed protein product n=1 Tax=Ambrosiozyma monospora TaxID=43982 RepID=A0ACB5TTG2_AMBMO|nr:unnamed protein product [Ambrosiozyma monospora]